MRKLIVSNIISLDGFYEGPGGDAGTIPISTAAEVRAFDAYNAERMREAEILLAGRRTFDGFRGYWPGVAENAEASPDERAIGRAQDTLRKVVVSDTLTADQTDPWRDLTTIVSRAGAPDRLTALKREEGGDILAFGSRATWNGLLPAGLVDELHLLVSSVVFGAGTPVFESAPQPPLRLLGAESLGESSLALLRYAADGR